MDDCREVADRLLAEGKAYEDEGAIRFRMPDEGVTGWDDVVRGRVEVANETIEDVVLVRSDGRPTYNFASPMEDVWDGITHVIRGDDHISNTPKQINVIRAVGGEVPRYAHVPSIFGSDGKKLSKRHGAVGMDEFRRSGYLPETMVNFLALLGWAPDGETTLMPRDELVGRFSLERVSPSPAQFDYAKLDWMNGVYLRALTEDEFAHRLVVWLGEHGYDWDAELVRKRRRSCRRRSRNSATSPRSPGSCSRTSRRRSTGTPRSCLRRATPSHSWSRSRRRRSRRRCGEFSSGWA